MSTYFLHYKLQLIVFIAASIALSIAAFQRNITWRNEMIIWHDAQNKSPLKARPHANVGLIYDREGAMDKAQEEYSRSIQLEPNYLGPYCPLAVIYGKRGDVDRAIQILLWVIPLLPDKDPKSYTTLGVAYKVKGMLNEAERALQEALRINPNYEIAHYNLAQVYEQMGLKEEALKHYKKFIENASPEIKEMADKFRGKF